jgi:hypothetical protein
MGVQSEREREREREREKQKQTDRGDGRENTREITNTQTEKGKNIPVKLLRVVPQQIVATDVSAACQDSAAMCAKPLPQSVVEFKLPIFYRFAGDAQVIVDD